MVRYSKNNPPSDQTQAEAMAIARGTQRPGQTKEQTKLIAQGIQKGIEQYKKQQKAKARERDKLAKRKAVITTEPGSEAAPAPVVGASREGSARLPWVLLLFSWVGFALLWFTRGS